MYQQSVDRSGGSQKSDLILFIVLIIAFFAVGAVVMYLEKLFDSNVPRYVFIGLVLAAIYAIFATLCFTKSRRPFTIRVLTI